MQTQNGHAGSVGWLGFELSVLRRLKFQSVALPLAGEPNLGCYLKRWEVRVSANDPAQWAWTKSQAFIENNSETLTGEDLDLLLDDAYVPRSFFRNPTLLSWFNETDAWWFDNVRGNAELLSSPYKRAPGAGDGRRRLCVLVQPGHPGFTTATLAFKCVSASLAYDVTASQQPPPKHQ